MHGLNWTAQVEKLELETFVVSSGEWKIFDAENIQDEGGVLYNSISCPSSKTITLSIPSWEIS